MLLRNHYACECGHKWVVVAENNHEDECSECQVKSWPAEIFQLAEEPFEPSNDLRPWRPDEKSYAGFEAVARTVLPQQAPTRPAERVEHPAPKHHSQLTKTRLCGGPSQLDMFKE